MRTIKIYHFLWLCVFLSLACHAEIKSNSSLEEPRRLLALNEYRHAVEFITNDAIVTIRPINKGTVEVFYQVKGLKQLPSFALADAMKNTKNTPAIGRLTKLTNGYKYELPELSLNISSHPFKISFSYNNTLLAEEELGLFVSEQKRGFRFLLDNDEKLIGGGQRVLGMDRRGHILPLYNKAHYGYSDTSEQMYYGLPAIMSDKKYIIAFDNSALGEMDLGATQANVLSFSAESGRTSYIFSAGESYLSLIDNFLSATGKQAMPPRWALGSFASRFGYRNQKEVLDIAKRYQKDDMPLDAIVIDLYWFGPDIKGHMGNLSWDKNNWPEPSKMMATLQKKNIKTIVITEPFILTQSSKFKDAKKRHALAVDTTSQVHTFDFYFGNTALLDVFKPEAQDWFWQHYRKLKNQGVDGWWGDLGEPEVHPKEILHIYNNELVGANELHNVYGHQWAKMVYERSLADSPDRRPFVMMRSGFLGTQRYGIIPWTGDVERSWAGLASQVELSLQMGLFGLAYTHSDLGGFAGGEEFDAELYTRWLQFGAFQPVFRPHAQDHIASEPVFHDKKTKDVVRKYLKLRYSLLPYNYSLSMQNALDGSPIMRPLFLHHTDANIDIDDTYLWGESILISPVVNSAQTQKQVYLPNGYWFNYWDQSIHQGGKQIKLAAPLDKMPMMVKAGAFIPSVDAINNTSAYTSKKLALTYYHHPSVESSSYQMLEDDGVSPNSLKEQRYQTLNFWTNYQASPHTNDHNSGKNQILQIRGEVKGQYTNSPKLRELSVLINNINSKPKAVYVLNQNKKKEALSFQYNLSTLQLSFGLTMETSFNVVIEQ